MKGIDPYSSLWSSQRSFAANGLILGGFSIIASVAVSETISESEEKLRDISL